MTRTTSYQRGLWDTLPNLTDDSWRLLSAGQARVVADAGLDRNHQAILLAELGRAALAPVAFGRRVKELARAQAQDAAEGGTQIGLFLGL